MVGGAGPSPALQLVNAMRPDRSDLTLARLWCDTMKHGYWAYSTVDALGTLEVLPEAMARIAGLLATDRRATAAAASSSLQALWAHALPTDVVRRLAATAAAQQTPLPAMLASLGEAVQRLLGYAYQAHWSESLHVIEAAYKVRPTSTAHRSPACRAGPAHAARQPPLV